jgi:branched-chain amino acid transport system permease protein
VTAEALAVSLLNGLSYGLLLFLLSAGLTLIFSLMGVLNFAHASIYMLGAYLGHTLSAVLGFWVALLVAPVLVGAFGAAFERYALRRVRVHGHIPELLITFGLSFVMLELVQLVWGRGAIASVLPAVLDGPLFTLFGMPYPRSRAFIVLLSVMMLLAMWLLIQRTRIGLVIQAALTHPQMVESLGHDVPRVQMLVFGGGAALAGLAGVVGGATFVTEPAMAQAMGAIVFVVAVVGGLGSLSGAFVASLLIGVLQNLAIAVDLSLVDALRAAGAPIGPAASEHSLLRLKLSEIAPILPFLLMVGVLVLRPRGLFGTRES